MRILSLFIQNCGGLNSRGLSRRLIHEKVWNDTVTVASEAGIKNCLTQLSIPFTDGYTCLHVKDCVCFKNSPDVKKNGDLFVNKRTGHFLCKHCKGTGDWSTFSNFLTKAKEDVGDLSKFKEEWKKYNEGIPEWKELVLNSEPFHTIDNDSLKSTLRNFGLPDFSVDALEKLRVRINNDKSLLIFPLCCFSSSVVGYKTFDADGVEVTYPKTDCPGVLKYSAGCNSAAVVVSKINDFHAVISQKLVGYDIICLQYGTSRLPQTTLPFLEKYDKLILWLGEGSLDSTGLFARKLGEKRCYIVRPVENQVTPTAAVAENENISEILSKAKVAWHESIISFSRLREYILAETQNLNECNGIPWERFPRLTQILKGHRRGELTILTGPTGIGKTTFISEYSLDLAKQGVNTLWGSFELKNTRLAKVLLTQFAENPIPKDLKAYNELCDKFEELPIYFLNFHGQQDLSRVMDAITHCSYTCDIAHVIIDNVQFMIEVCPDLSHLDRFWKQDFMIQSFRSFASKFNCHVTLVMHPKKVEGLELNMNSIFGGAKATQEADNVLIMQKREINNFDSRTFLQSFRTAMRYAVISDYINMSVDNATCYRILQEMFKRFVVMEMCDLPAVKAGIDNKKGKFLLSWNHATIKKEAKVVDFNKEYII